MITTHYTAAIKFKSKIENYCKQTNSSYFVATMNKWDQITEKAFYDQDYNNLLMEYLENKSTLTLQKLIVDTTDIYVFNIFETIDSASCK
jgi:hypothetical protein